MIWVSPLSGLNDHWYILLMSSQNFIDVPHSGTGVYSFPLVYYMHSNMIGQFELRHPTDWRYGKPCVRDGYLQPQPEVLGRDAVNDLGALYASGTTTLLRKQTKSGSCFAFTAIVSKRALEMIGEGPGPS
jgi:hypothetical protein